MRKCPFCLQEIPEELKVCKHCGERVVRNCPRCAAEVVATARICRFCSASLEPAPGPGARADLPCGDRREVVLTLILIFLTCGLYGLYVQFKIGQEINLHQGKDRIHAGMDVLLLFLTCGLWSFYLMYKYPRELQEMVQEEGGSPGDLVLPCLLFTFLGLHLVSLLILQGELNKHWELHQAPPG